MSEENYNEISDDSLYEENQEESEEKPAEEQSDSESQLSTDVKSNEDQEVKGGSESQLPTVSTDVKSNEDEDQEANELYSEFKEFLQDKQDMTEDTGEKPVIPTGIDLLDAILGGGFGIGCMNILIGNPGCGKSSIAAQVLGNAQQMNKGKLLAGFLDAEQAMTTKRLFNLGVKRPKIKPYSDMTVEKVFKYIEALALFKEQKKMQDIPSLVIWDSIANTLTEKQKETDDINKVIGQKANLLSNLIPTYLEKCSKYNICLLAVNQLRESIQMNAFPQAPDLKFLPNKDMPGGQALKFNAFQLLHMQIRSEISTAKGHKYPFDGLVVRAKCAKNKLFTPNIEVELVSTYAGGVSNFWTNYHFLSETKRLKAGAWNSLVKDPTQRKWRTKDAKKMYDEDEDFRYYFDEAVKEGIQYDIIEKYGD